MKRNKLIDQVMNEPVMCGGFVWSYGFLSAALRKSGISDIYLAAATNRPISGSDTRKLSWERATELWNALEVADMPVINACVQEMSS